MTVLVRFALPCLALLLAGCGSSTTSPGAVTPGGKSLQTATILLDWNPNSDHGGLYTALRDGEFARRGVAPTIRLPSNATGQIQLVAAGRADFAVTYEADLLAARARGLPVRSVMCIMQHPLNTVMTLRRSGITRPRQLVGRTVGMAGSPNDVPTVSAMMRHDGASAASVKMVNVGYNLLPALLSGRVDAVVGVYWTWERILAERRGDPVNVMRVERWGMPNYCELVFITSERLLRDSPALVQNVVRALQRGYARAESDPQDAWRDLATASGTLRRQRAVVVRSLVLLRGAVLDAPTIGYQNPVQWRRYAAWLRANGLLTGRFSSAGAFTNRFLAPRVR